LPLLSSIRFLCAQLSSLSRSHWMAAQPDAVSTTPPSLVSAHTGAQGYPASHVPNDPGPAPRTRLSRRQVTNLLFTLHHGPCTLEELMNSTEPPTSAERQRMGTCRQRGRRDRGMQGRGLRTEPGAEEARGALGAGGQRPPCSAAGDKGTLSPAVGQAELAVLADQGHLTAHRPSPRAVWKDRFSGLKSRGRNARPSAALPHGQSVGQRKVLQGRHIRTSGKSNETPTSVPRWVHAGQDLAPSAPPPRHHSVGAVHPEPSSCSRSRQHTRPGSTASPWAGVGRSRMGWKSCPCPLAPSAAPTPPPARQRAPPGTAPSGELPGCLPRATRSPSPGARSQRLGLELPAGL